jgi:hypothetical protein
LIPAYLDTIDQIILKDLNINKEEVMILERVLNNSSNNETNNLGRSLQLISIKFLKSIMLLGASLPNFEIAGSYQGIKMNSVKDRIFSTTYEVLKAIKNIQGNSIQEFSNSSLSEMEFQHDLVTISMIFISYEIESQNVKFTLDVKFDCF